MEAAGLPSARMATIASVMSKLGSRMCENAIPPLLSTSILSEERIREIICLGKKKNSNTQQDEKKKATQKSKKGAFRIKDNNEYSTHTCPVHMACMSAFPPKTWCCTRSSGRSKLAHFPEALLISWATFGFKQKKKMTNKINSK